MNTEYRKVVYPDGTKKEFDCVKRGDIFYVEEVNGETLKHPDGLTWMYADEDYEQNVLESKSHVVAHYIEYLNKHPEDSKEIK